MFDNLLGAPLGGLNAPVLSSQGSSSSHLSGREITSGNKDKSLIVNSYGSIVAGRDQQLSGKSDGAVASGELLAEGM